MMKRKVAYKFYWPIIISVFFSVLVSSITVATYLLGQFEDEVLRKDELHIKGLAGNVKGFIDRAFSINYQLSVNPILTDSIIKAAPDWKTRLTEYEKQYDTTGRLMQKSGLPLLVNMHKKYDFVELFFLQDITGKQTARSCGTIGYRGKRWWFKKIMANKDHSSFFSKSYFSMTGNKPVSSAFHPVFNNNGLLIGILGMDINFDFLQEFVSQHLYSKDLWAMITDNEGVIIAHPDKAKLRELYNLKNMTREVLNATDFDKTDLDAGGYMKTRKETLDWAPEISQIVKNAIAGQSGYIYDVLMNSNKSTLYYRPVKLPGNSQNNFSIILVRDNSTLYYTKVRIVIFVIVFTVITILLLILLFHVYFKRIILNPLDILTRSIKDADLTDTKPVDLNTNDEFQVLGETFNSMHNTIKSANEKLEEKVEKRTAELRNINQKLSQEIEKHQITAEKLRTAKEAAETASAAKSQFLANISHELRTPMHGILGFAKLGLDKVETIKREKIRKYLSEIASSGRRLMILLDDLLDLSRLESGRVEYTFETHHMSEPVYKVLSQMSVLQQEKDIQIVFKKPDFNDKAEFDKGKIIQVMQNLISNSIKFSKVDGYIKIYIVQNEDSLMVTVEDNGIGIPENELATVFDKFIQSSKTSSGAGGTGLGLSICQNIIQDHRGKIWAEINAEGGAIVRFQIPKFQRNKN